MKRGHLKLAETNKPDTERIPNVVYMAGIPEIQHNSLESGTPALENIDACFTDGSKGIDGAGFSAVIKPSHYDIICRCK